MQGQVARLSTSFRLGKRNESFTPGIQLRFGGQLLEEFLLAGGGGRRYNDFEFDVFVAASAGAFMETLLAEAKALLNRCRASVSMPRLVRASGQASTIRWVGRSRRSESSASRLDPAGRQERSSEDAFGSGLEGGAEELLEDGLDEGGEVAVGGPVVGEEGVVVADGVDSEQRAQLGGDEATPGFGRREIEGGTGLGAARDAPFSGLIGRG